MKKQTILKVAVDAGMTLLLMLLMAYELIGRNAHEWLGVGMFVLFVFHHILNRKWIAHLGKGTYTPVRIFQTILVFLVLVCILSSMISGILMSRYVFAFLPISFGRSFARILHMLGAYWGLVFLSLHLGFHWNSMMGMARRAAGKSSAGRAWGLRILGLCIAVYGIFAFVRRGIGTYMFLQSAFVFFDYEEPLVLFYLDYLAIMGLFVWLGHYLSQGLRKFSVGRRSPR